MKKSYFFVTLFVAVLMASNAFALTPLVIDEWDGIPSKQVRLKGYCKVYEGDLQWTRNAVFYPGEKISLSTEAINYLNSLTIPEGEVCTAGDTIGPAWWYPDTDTVIWDNPPVIPPMAKPMSIVLQVAYQIAANQAFKFDYPFVYSEWDGIPAGQVRLKGYCVESKWNLNAVAHTGQKAPLSDKAKNYLNSLPIPRGSCTSGDAIGSAWWYIATDTIAPD